jgi:acyl-CoA reductase-like NAD-dependent aldehyde dehydrogenase
MSEFTMTIDGKSVAGEINFGVINPATEEVFAECPECTQIQLDLAMDAAKRAFPEWRQDEASLSFSDVDDAVERANATHYGLGGRIWTNDLEQGAELAARLECGLGRVNQPAGFITPFVPFGVVKWSGIGSQNGIEGLEAFTQLQAIGIAKE